MMRMMRIIVVYKWLLILILLPVPINGHARLLKNLPLTVDNLVRHYDLYVPEHIKEPLPLVLLYHGHFGSSELMLGKTGKKAPYKRWLALADREKFLVAVPNGEKGSDDKRGWNDCRADSKTNPKTDDVKFTLQLIDTIDRQYPVDRERIYATGTSNGGNMVIRLAMEVPEKFAAIAAVVASNPVKNKCTEKRKPISVLFMNGTADPILPYQGGKIGKEKFQRGLVLSTPASVDYWRKVNGTASEPEVHLFEDINTEEESTVIKHRYKGGKNNTEVVLYEVRNGGHTEPSKTEKYSRLYKWVVGNQNYDIEMADEVWEFFKSIKR